MFRRLGEGRECEWGLEGGDGGARGGMVSGRFLVWMRKGELVEEGKGDGIDGEVSGQDGGEVRLWGWVDGR